MSQVMNLTHLAPDIQEAILFLPPTYTGRDPITETHLRPISAQLDWVTQRRMWQHAERAHSPPCFRRSH